ncbi:MAG: BTAD domain-containing putative transcriptional regulator [Beijerinckiaceae bacterium]
MFDIRLFGHFGISLNGTPVTIAKRKSQALVALLALTDGHSAPRDRLTGLLWSEADEEKARGSLRQALYEVNSGLAAAGAPPLLTDKLSVGIQPAMLRIDVAEALSAARGGEVHPVFLESVDPFEDMLGALESVDPAFSGWLGARRRALEGQFVRAFEAALSARLEDEGLARALLAIDPTHEVAVRAVMASRVTQGDLGGAFGAYKSLWELLENEYDTEPSRATQEYFAALKLGTEEVAGGAPVAAPAVLATPRRPAPVDTPAPPMFVAPNKLLLSIAAFDTSGAPAANHYLVHGFRRDLIASLVRFREWLVRDGAASPIPTALNREEYVIEASAYQSQGEMKLSLMLRENVTGIYLWSERISLVLDEWLEAQQTVVRRLAAVLNVHISSERLALASHRAAESSTAYDLWLKAQALRNTWEPDSFDQSVALLRRITDEYPAFAPAYSSLAQTHNSAHFTYPGRRRSTEQTREAFEAATEAARLDPVDSRSHLCLGWAYANSGQHARAGVHHSLAQELNDTDTWTMISSSLGAAARGDLEAADRMARQALELCVVPTALHWAYLSQVHFLCGDLEACVEAAGIAGRVIPSAPGWRIAALGQLGRAAQARKEMEDLVSFAASRWFGDEPPTTKSTAEWFLHLFPYATEDAWKRATEGFSRAGIPVGAARFVAGY